MNEENINYPDYIFEVSWEVCNLVGGIYTVLSTKAHTLQKIKKDRNIFIGPDVWKNKECPFFKESKSLLKEWKEQACQAGIPVRVGRWKIPGEPIAVLVDFSHFETHKNELYSKMWEWYQVSSLEAYGDYDEACTFAYASALVIENFYQYIHGEELKVIAHFDEWTTGMGLLHVKHTLPHVATIFTTHATSMGRSIAGNNKPLYDYLVGYNGDQMARELNMVSKHSLEKKAAWNADCFTTVSHITARECAQLLEKQPQVITTNGFENTFVPQAQEYTQKRTVARKKLLRVVGEMLGYTPQDDAFLLMTSGRYEYKNKGIDLFIESLKQLCSQYNGDREVIAFIMVPGYVADAREELKQRLQTDLVSDTPLQNPLLTHNLHNYDDDKVMGHLRSFGFENHAANRVKIVFVPSYLTGSDGIFDMPYYDLLIGFDATAFPSYYEPWGYTPLESVAFGIPTITTDLSGFGLWVSSSETNNPMKDGVEVLHRTDSNTHEVTDSLTQTLMNWIQMPQQEMKKMRSAAKKTAAKAEWKNFIVHYILAFDIALKKKLNMKQYN